MRLHTSVGDGSYGDEMRFIATADWQLGMTASYLTAEARPRFAQARLDVIRAIGELAAERAVDFVLVCGDVFESNQLDRQVVLRAFDALRAVAVPVYLLPGNHDPLDSASIYTSATFRDRCPDHVHVLAEPGPVTVLPGVEVVAAPWSTKAPLCDLVARACADLGPSDDVIRIVAGHGVVDTLNPDRDSLAAISVAALQAQVDAGRIHMCVLGDRHSTTQVTERIWYAGAPEVTDRDETDPGNVLVVDIDTAQPAARVAVERVHVGRWEFEVAARELGSVEDVDALVGWLDGHSGKDRTAIWLKLSGTLSVRDKARLDAALEEQAEIFGSVLIWERHYDLSVVPDDCDFGDLGLTGFADDAVRELVQMAGCEPGGAEAQDALGLLYRLTEASR